MPICQIIVAQILCRTLLGLTHFVDFWLVLTPLACSKGLVSVSRQFVAFDLENPVLSLASRKMGGFKVRSDYFQYTEPARLSRMHTREGLLLGLSSLQSRIGNSKPASLFYGFRVNPSKPPLLRSLSSLRSSNSPNCTNTSSFWRLHSKLSLSMIAILGV